MKLRRTGLLSAAVAALLACTEKLPPSAYVSPTPYPSPSPVPTPIAISVPDFVDAEIMLDGEVDVYSFTAATGDEIRIDLDAEGLTPPSSQLDARITLYAPDGALMAISEDGTSVANPRLPKDPYLVFTAPVAGDYTFTVEDTDGGGGVSGYDYELRLSRVVSTPLNGGAACGDSPLLVIGTGLSVTGTTVGGTASCCSLPLTTCVGGYVDGPDVIYRARVEDGTRMQVARTGGGFDGVVFVTTSCGTADAVVVDSCITGGDGSDDADGFVFTAAFTGTYYFFVDGVTAASEGAYLLDLRVMQ